MEDRIEGLKDGIIACFDLLTELRGEEVAVIYSEAPPQAADPTVSEVDNENDLTSDPGSSSSSGASSEANGITFMEIQYAYQSVAAQLRFRFGVALGDTVLVICKGQAAAEIVAMLACIKVGATFVPVDNSWVTAGTRLRDIVQDTRPPAAIVVADSDNDPCVLALAAVGLYRCVYLNDNGDIVESFNTLRDDSGFAVDTYSYDSVDEAEPGVAVTEAHPLYILCTSGSTGRPKGVLGTHKGLLSRIAWQWRRFPFGPGEVVCRRTPLVFVDSMAEIFSALLSLTPLWCPPKQRLVAEGIGGIASEANEAGVSRITLLPSQLQQALSLYPDLGDTWQSLKTIFVSGEECTAGLVRAVKERLPEVTLVNLYGSTEVAGDVSFAVLAAADGTAVDTEGASVMPIGEPIEGNFLLVVSVGDADTPLRLLPDGEVGELMVVGTHLALGYDYVDPSGSAKFIDNPLRRFGEADTELGSKVSPEASEYERAYMTGDLAYRSTQDGLFYLCGRKDRQVKIRGVRIELEDVERQACKALGLDDGVVVLAVAPDASAGDAVNAAILVAVLDDQSLTKSGRSSTESIRRRLQEALVPSMVPAIVLTVQAFPRNTTGKLDRRPLQRQVEDTFPTATGTGALPGQSHGAAASSVEQLRSALSNLTLSEWLQEIVRIYTEVLGVSAPEGSIDSVDFFALGGDSVRMIEVLWRLRQWTGLSVGPAELRLPVGELAVRLRSRLSSGAPEIRDEGKAESPQKRAKLAHDSLERGSQPSSDGYPEPIRGISVTIPAGAVLTSASRASAGCASHAAVTGLAQEWSVRLSKCIDATPLVITWSGAQTGNSVALVIVGSHGGDLVAVNAATGQEVWKLQLGEHIEAAAVLDASTGLLFVGTFSGQDVDGFVSRRPVGSTSEAALGCLWAINAETGVVCWHVCTKGEIKSAAVVLGSTMVVGSYDGHVYHIRCRDGHLMDKHACGGSIFAAPVVLSDEQRLLVVTTSGMVTLFALGQDEQPLTVLSSAHMVSMFSTPLACTVNGASCALLAGTDGSLRCVRAESDLGEVWCESVSATSFFSSACVIPGAAAADAVGCVATAVIGCHDGKLRKVSLVEGAVLWECVLGVAIFASPRLLQGGEDCVVATVAGDVVVVSVATGQVRAKMRLPAEVFSSPVCHAGHLYVGCRDDKLYCVKLL